MSEDWKVGDLAACVDASPCECCGAPIPLSEGEVRRVIGIEFDGDIMGLVINGTAVMHNGFRAIGEHRFRKIRPDEHEGEREDWQLLLDSMKRKVRA